MKGRWETEIPSTRGIVRHDSHLRKSGIDPAGDLARLTPGWEASRLTAQPPRPPGKRECPPAKDEVLSLFPFVKIRHVKKIHPSGHYYLGGYSFGATVAFEMALQLENMGEKVSLFLIGGSPSWLSTYVDNVRPAGETTDSSADENAALAYFVSEYLDLDIHEVRNKFETSSPRVKRSTLLAKLLAARSSCPSEQIVAAADSLYKRITTALTYKPKEKFKGSVSLFRTQNHDSNISYECDLFKVKAHTNL
ncbi:hypothetical protein PR048_003511 [Dryococelus australis]|uniref:oleoyl-[acyl-carrier-protein] hydrolase n=1 Tax=Dryococelus australis TaxID=614101 RepID=A0ABQ9INB1_9NEOP|nr:hypothetical protein PR048_003511 [Dryococelus australis]